MKKLILTLLLLTGTCYADGPATSLRSSFTATNDTNVAISSAGYLDAIIIGVASAGGFLSVFNSSYTNNLIISSVSLATVGERHLGVGPLKGIVYTTVGNTGGVTIIYRKD